MKKHILLILTVAAFLLGTPQTQAQDIQHPAAEQELKEIVITVNNATLKVKNADKMTLEVYNMAGMKVASLHIDSPEKTFELEQLPKGCYIVRVGKVARKVYLR